MYAFLKFRRSSAKSRIFRKIRNPKNLDLQGLSVFNFSCKEVKKPPAREKIWQVIFLDMYRTKIQRFLPTF